MSKTTRRQMADLLRNVPLFEELSKRELSLLAGVAEEQEFASGDTITAEDDQDLSLHVVVEGTAKVTVGGRTRRRLKDGDFLGEIALLHNVPRTATVTAETDVTTFMIPAWSFNAVLKSQPELALKMLRVVSKRLYEAEGDS